jgi:two-component sensor histidine kinase/ligand-binding sensor domain-containing protein
MVANSKVLFSQGIGLNEHYMITKRLLSIEDGLPSRLISASIQDKDGFMWFATANGLSRYDGNVFKNYNTKNSKLHSNLVTQLFIDADNHLYIKFATDPLHSDQNLNLQVLDLMDYSFKRLEDIFPDAPINPEKIQSVSSDGLGNTFFLMLQPDQVWQYSKKSGFRMRSNLKKLSDKDSAFSTANAQLISSLGCAAVKIRGCNQINCIFPNTAFAIKTRRGFDTQLVGINTSGEIVYFEEKTNIYHAIDRDGTTKSMSVKPLGISTPEDTTSDISLNQNQVLYKMDKYKQWYVLQGNGFVLVRDTLDIRNIGMNSIYSVFRDRLGNIWFSTPRGVYQVTIHENKFQHLFANNRFVKFEHSIRGIYADLKDGPESDNKIYVLFETDNLRIQSKQSVTEISEESGFAILKKKDIFYISNTRLLSYNPSKNEVRTLTDYANIGEIWSMASLSDSLLVLGGSNGVMLYNENTHQIRQIPMLQHIKQPPSFVYRFLKSTQKGWIAVAENGIYFINDRFEIVDYYASGHPQMEKRMPFTGIYDLYEDKAGVAWLAMNGEGLIRWNWNTRNPMAAENIKKFTVDNGLPDNILYRVEEDAFNNLWISSYNGLVRFNKSDFSTKIYKSKDGLANLEFNRISSFKDANGWMYFGGFNGIDAFDPAKMKDDIIENSLPFRLTGLTKFSTEKNMLMEVLNEFNADKKLTMNVGDRFLTVSFSLLDFENRTHRYAYRIEGMDKDWNYINENSIRISSLPYGKMTIHIKTQLESGNWNAQEIVISVAVLKPFYLQYWFVVSALIILIGVVYGIFFYRTRKFNKAAIKLEQVVQDRTQSLNATLHEKEILLTEIHHRVKNNLQVISGLLELRKLGIEDEQGKAAFNESQSGIMSIALIHELLYQNENVGSLEFNVILNNIISNVTQLFGKQDKKIAFDLVPNQFVFNMDTAVTLGLIMNELLTNAFKYLPGNKHNRVVIEIKEWENGAFWMSFRDNGPGLALGFSFEKVTTIGFSMLKSLAMQLHGSISYEYQQGSKFVVIFKERNVKVKN